MLVFVKVVPPAFARRGQHGQGPGPELRLEGFLTEVVHDDLAPWRRELYADLRRL